jgi:hypothetical protein
VLSSKTLYNRPRIEIHLRLTGLIKMRGVRLSSKALYLRALDIYLAYPALSFVDFLCIAYAERENQPSVRTFHQDFDLVLTITRQEP